jgi:hypothetical protein
MKLSPLLCSLAAITFLEATAPAQSAEVSYRVYGRAHAELTKARMVGDIDGDLAQDYLVGSAFAPKYGNVGYCALISGIDGSLIREHYGLTDVEHFGLDFSGMHDLNGDGIPEYAITVPGRRSSSGDLGCVMIYDGATGADLRELRDPFVHVRFGDGVVGGTDFTGDGVPDLAVITNKGNKIKVYNGNDLLGSLGPSIIISTGISSNYRVEQMVRPLVAMPDYDGDGIADLCMNPQGGFYAATTIYSTGTQAPIFHSNYAGYAIPFVDINGDGIPEFAMGDYQSGGYDDPTGEVWVYDGATLTEIWGYNAVYHGWRAHGLGTSIAMIEDLTGDGIPELASGCGAYGRANTASPAAVVLLDGANGSMLGITGTANTVLANKTLGRNLESGDIDGDGELELLVGIPETHHKFGGFVDPMAGVILACEIDS